MSSPCVGHKADPAKGSTREGESLPDRMVQEEQRGSSINLEAAFPERQRKQVSTKKELKTPAVPSLFCLWCRI